MFDVPCWWLVLPFFFFISLFLPFYFIFNFRSNHEFQLLGFSILYTHTHTHVQHTLREARSAVYTITFFLSSIQDVDVVGLIRKKKQKKVGTFCEKNPECILHAYARLWVCVDPSGEPRPSYGLFAWVNLE